MVKMASAGIDINGIPYDEAIKNEGTVNVSNSLPRLEERTKHSGACAIPPSKLLGQNNGYNILSLKQTSHHPCSFAPSSNYLDVEPLDESLTRRLQAQQQQVEELTLSVAERRKRVPEQVKMLLDDAIKRQSALADRIEFEPEEGKDNQNGDSDMENG